MKLPKSIVELDFSKLKVDKEKVLAQEVIDFVQGEHPVTSALRRRIALEGPTYGVGINLVKPEPKKIYDVLAMVVLTEMQERYRNGEIDHWSFDNFEMSPPGRMLWKVRWTERKRTEVTILEVEIR